MILCHSTTFTIRAIEGVSEGDTFEGVREISFGKSKNSHFSSIVSFHVISAAHGDKLKHCEYQAENVHQNRVYL